MCPWAVIGLHACLPVRNESDVLQPYHWLSGSFKWKCDKLNVKKKKYHLSKHRDRKLDITAGAFHTL